MKEEQHDASNSITTKGFSPKFLVDGMLGTLAVKLRILGFDSVYDKSSDDSHLLTVARKEGRYLVTSDLDLFLRARRSGEDTKEVLITSVPDIDRVVELFTKLGINSIPPTFDSRCSECNGVLRLVGGKKTREGNAVYECVECKKEYWKGSHWRKLDEFIAEANIRLRSYNARRDSEGTFTRHEKDANISGSAV